MAKKLKGRAEEGSVTQLMMDSAQQIWLAGLGALGKSRAEGSKLFDSLVKEGQAVQARASKAANAQMSQISKTASGTWDKLEEVFERRVSKSLHKLGVPTHGEIEALNKHVNKLNASVQALLVSSKAPRKAPTKRAAAKASKPASSATPPA